MFEIFYNKSTCKQANPKFPPVSSVYIEKTAQLWNGLQNSERSGSYSPVPCAFHSPHTGPLTAIQVKTLFFQKALGFPLPFEDPPQPHLL